ncbi:MAG: CsbD family protein [Candidatus Nanopelagicales bacterium]
MAVNADKIKGRAKVAAGAALGDKDLENEGRMDRWAGEAKDLINQVADKAQNLTGSASRNAGDYIGKARTSLESLVDKIKR